MFSLFQWANYLLLNTLRKRCICQGCCPPQEGDTDWDNCFTKLVLKAHYCKPLHVTAQLFLLYLQSFTHIVYKSFKTIWFFTSSRHACCDVVQKTHIKATYSAAKDRNSLYCTFQLLVPSQRDSLGHYLTNMVAPLLCWHKGASFHWLSGYLCYWWRLSAVIMQQCLRIPGPQILKGYSKFSLCIQVCALIGC